MCQNAPRATGCCYFAGGLDLANFISHICGIFCICVLDSHTRICDVVHGCA